MPPAPFLGEFGPIDQVETPAVITSNLTVDAGPVGQGFAPLWAANPAVQELRFTQWDTQAGQPLRDDEQGAPLFALGLGARGQAAGLALGLTGQVRVPLNWNAVPQAVQMDVRTSAGALEAPTLVLRYASGETQTVSGDALAREATRERSFEWQPERAGERLLGADLILPVGQQGATLEGLRLMVLPR